MLVADAMGHGLGAAPITMLVEAAFQETASETAEPAALLAGMDMRPRLEPRDVLLMASDGLGSVATRSGQCRAERRLRQTRERLAGRDGRSVADGRVADAVRFGRRAALPDDVHLVAVLRAAPAA